MGVGLHDIWNAMSQPVVPNWSRGMGARILRRSLEVCAFAKCRHWTNCIRFVASRSQVPNSRSQLQFQLCWKLVATSVSSSRPITNVVREFTILTVNVRDYFIQFPRTG